MAGPVYDRVVGELARLDFSGRVSFHFYNEPLLRKDLEVLVVALRSRVPRAIPVLYTNGDFLTDDRYASLCAAGVESFIVTRHDFTPIAERPKQLVLTPDDLVITNRGGAFAPSVAVPERTPCYAPDEMLIVTVTGDVVLCYEDAHRRHVMGNVMERPLEHIWFSEAFVKVRSLLLEGLRSDASALCANCDNLAHTQAGSSFFAL
jgi:2-deoxy-scyllo-inosamine dehydrogenase (SAM-dependent)